MRKVELTVLVVVNEPLLRAIIRTVLSAKGYQILETDSGARALHLARTFPGSLNLLIVDHPLNDRDQSGRTACTVAEEIRRSRRTVKVLQISGEMKDHVERSRQRVPNSEFLLKPFTIFDLLAKTDAMFRPRRTMAKVAGR